MTIAGMTAGLRHNAAALGEGGRLVAVCAQERVTRVRGGVSVNGRADEALDVLLARAGRSRADLSRVAWVGEGARAGSEAPLDAHFAHACTAYLTSPCAEAAILVCDYKAPAVSLWRGRDGRIVSEPCSWTGPGFAELYWRCATALGFAGEARAQRFEALARLEPQARDPRLGALMALDGDRLHVDEGFDRVVAEHLARTHANHDRHRATVAAALQAGVGDLVLEFASNVHQRLGVEALCVGGSLFNQSAINTRLRLEGPFREVFIPVDPGDAGLAAGAVLHALGARPAPVSPFLGPSYSTDETKEVLDNCKLQYAWEPEERGIAAAVQALRDGRLVAWFDEAMEWGPRALGARSILASPTAPYVLENLNHFLKRREPWRGYALSILQDALPEYFDGPASAPFMECEFRPRNPEACRHVLPAEGAAIRLHTVAGPELPRFTRLLEAFRAATGVPFLVNTSFNGFHEPIVCSPRDAVRVFYGTGLDVLWINHFLLSK